jgi:hypothetical protein
MSRLYGVPPKDFLQESTLDKEQKQAVLAAVQEVVEDNGTRRSALLRWMVDNHDEFFEMVSQKRPNWKRLAEVFTNLGLSEDDKPLAPQTVRHYWWRVRCMKQGVKPKRRRASKAKPSVPPGVPPVVRVHAPASPRPTPPPTLPAPVIPVPAESSDALSEDAEQKARAEKAHALCLAEMDKRSGR